MPASEPPAPAHFHLVGDVLCLDLLNTVVAGCDLLPDFASYLRWLALVGVDVGPENTPHPPVRWQTDSPATRAALAAVKDLRETLRGAVDAFTAGAPVPDQALAVLNPLLARSPVRVELVRGSEEEETVVRLQKRFHLDWKNPADLLTPVAESAADFFCNADPSLVRRCDGTGCTMVFLDRTRNHRRRWCSMAVCGNRAKVAAHRMRQKNQPSR